MRATRTVIAVGLLTAWAVSAFQPPEFDVVAIKRSESSLFIINPGMHNGTFHAQNVPLRSLIAAAWGVTDSRVFGPDAITANRFEVLAKASSDVPRRAQSAMLQAMLRERFGLRAHTEMRSMPVYNLVVAKGGIKMPVPPAEEPPVDPAYGYSPQMAGTGTVKGLAKQLSWVLQRPVIDRTGDTRQFVYRLHYAPLAPTSNDKPELSPPDIFAAIQQQLGLKLNSARGEVEVVVVDAVNPLPTEN